MPHFFDIFALFRLCLNEAAPFVFLLLLAEEILAYSAKGTLKILGKILELRAGSNSLVGSAKLLVIFPSASVAYIFCHIY